MVIYEMLTALRVHGGYDRAAENPECSRSRERWQPLAILAMAAFAVIVVNQALYARGGSLLTATQKMW